VVPAEKPLVVPAEPWEQRWPPLRYWIKVTLVIVATIAVVAAARSIANILVLVLIAVVLAVGLDPVVRGLGSIGLGRGVTVLVLILSVIGIVIAFGMLVVPPLVNQATGLADDVPRYIARLSQRDDIVGDAIRRNDVVPKVQDFIQHLPQQAGASFDTILGVAGSVGSVVFRGLTVMILTVYFLLALPSMRRTATILFPEDQRRQGERVMDRSIDRIGGYVAGNLITSVVCGAVTLVALLLIGVPFAVPLAIWAGLADLIPLVGAYLGAAPAIIVAFFVSPIAGVITLAFFIIYQQFENYVLVPRVMRDAVSLSPAAVIISTLAGGAFAGLAGALLALPVAATIKVLVMDLWLRDRVKEGDEFAKERYLEERRSEHEAASTSRRRSDMRRRILAKLGISGGDHDDQSG
jgi:predicted PurR-regulated permease PerM